MQLNRRDFLKLSSLLPLLIHQLNQPFSDETDFIPGEEFPNIVILVFDALSSENMSLYGYNRITTPNLDRFAERAMVYHSHYAGGSFTSSGTASLLTGTYPWTHRAIHLHGTVDEKLARRNLFEVFKPLGYHSIAYSHNLLATSLLYQFRESIISLLRTRELCLIDDQFADRLFPADFNVAFWSEWLMMRSEETNPSSLFLSMVHRFYRALRKRGVTKDYGEEFPRGIPSLHNLFFVLEDAIDWIMEKLLFSPKPYLCYFHLLPPHEPYTTRGDYLDLFDDDWAPTPKQESPYSEGYSTQSLDTQRRYYDEYLAYADGEFGRLYDFMNHEGLFENTYLIVTSDHGEMFERGIRGHVTPTLYQPITRIPLIISRPGQVFREDIFTPTSCIDLIPTLLSETKQSIPQWCEGKILPGFSHTNDSNDYDIYSMDAKSNPKMGEIRNASISLIRGEFKLISYLGYEGLSNAYELYNLSKDPGERNDLSISHTGILKDLLEIMETKLGTVNENFIGGRFK